MASLEEVVRAAAAKGLTHLSLHPVHSEDRKTVYWRCTATPSTMHKYVHVTTTDPVEAILAVLASLPKAPARQRTSVTGAPTPATDDGPVTVAVIPEPSDLAGAPDPVDLHDGPNDEWSRFK